MKKNIIFLLTLCITTQIAAQDAQEELQANINAIQQVTQIIQTAAQKAVLGHGYPLRSTNSQDITQAIVDAIEDELNTFTGQSEKQNLSAEQQKIVELLEQYLEHYQSYSSFLKPEPSE